MAFADDRRTRTVSSAPQLLFVYNADSGVFNLFADIGHKIFSPETYSCSLCALTHGYLQERGQWRSFIDGLACRCDFLHRDEFRAAHPDDSTPLPALFIVDAAAVRCAADADAIGECRDLDALQALVQRCCDSAYQGRPNK